MSEAVPSVSNYQSRAKPITIGERFTRWLVVGEGVPRTNGAGHRQRMLLCRCDCGVEKNLLPGSLRYGSTRSCGCLQKEVCSRRSRTHGHTVGYRQHPLYNTWVKMRSRTRNRKDAGWAYYGGRGITISDDWFECFDTFLADMGPRPTRQHSVDRIDNTQGYCAENCRWADKTVQARNTRKNRIIVVRGVPRVLAEISKTCGVSEHAIRMRIESGWPLDEIDVPALTPAEACQRASQKRWSKRADLTAVTGPV